jgi:hypothetical protein
MILEHNVGNFVEMMAVFGGCVKFGGGIPRLGSCQQLIV